MAAYPAYHRESYISRFTLSFCHAFQFWTHTHCCNLQTILHVWSLINFLDSKWNIMTGTLIGCIISPCWVTLHLGLRWRYEINWQFSLTGKHITLSYLCCYNWLQRLLSDKHLLTKLIYVLLNFLNSRLEFYLKFCKIQ